MWKFALLVCLFAAFAQAYVEHDNFFADNINEQGKIQIKLKIEGKIACAGAIVPPAKTVNEEEKTMIIITAAHCVYKKPSTVGEYNIISDNIIRFLIASRIWAVQVNTSQETKSVSNIFIHPYYNPPSRDYDVAIIKVQLRETSDFVSLNLTKVSPKAGTNVNLLDKKSEEKNGTVIDRAICKNKLKDKIRVTSKMVCVQVTDIKQFFDGSPVYDTDNSLAGIISYRSQEMPIVFTNFAHSEVFGFINKYK